MKTRSKLNNGFQLLLIPLDVKYDGPVLDEKQGGVNRDRGIKKAVKHADEKNKDWLLLAYKLLCSFINNHNGPFMCEEARVYAEGLGLPEPPTKKAWGGVIQKARAEKIISRIGYRPVRNKNANCTPAAIWMPIKKVV